jgi:hypothetical protein
MTAVSDPNQCEMSNLAAIWKQLVGRRLLHNASHMLQRKLAKVAAGSEAAFHNGAQALEQAGSNLEGIWGWKVATLQP